MRSIKRVALVLVVLALALLILVFVLENQQQVSLVLLGWSIPALPVSVLVTLSLIIGMLAGPMIALLIRPVRAIKRRLGE